MRTVGLVAVTAVLTAISLPVGALADATPARTAVTPFNDIDPAVLATMRAEQPLVAAATRIEQAAQQGKAPNGYAGIGIRDNRVTVWWKGRVSGAVSAAIAEARHSVTVRVVPAAHSRAELEAAGRGIVAYMRANPAAGYHSVRIAYDGSRMVVGANPTAGRLAATRLPAAMKVPAGIPVLVEEGPPPQSAAGRLSDTSPFWGGGRIQNNDNASSCTAGFAVRRLNVNYMLTAGHCGRRNGSFNNGDDSAFFGTGAIEDVEHDVLMLDASVAGRIFDHANGAAISTKDVEGYVSMFVGMHLCQSGSVSGNVCNYEVDWEMAFSYCDTDVYGRWECYNDLVIAWQTDGLPGLIPGDSGGPVYRPANSTQVSAAGIMSGWWGSRLIFQDFDTIRGGVTSATPI